MNYSKNINRKSIARRALVSAIWVFVFGLVVGVGCGWGIKAHITAKQGGQSDKQTNIQSEDKTLVYGAYDNRTFTQEISLDWGIGDLDFEPLKCSMPYEEQGFLFYLCNGYDIDFCLVMAMIQVESEFRADAVSVTNDYGYMQINKVNHEWLTETLGVTEYLDPYQNMRAGCFTLRKLFERYQDTELVLMAYNMGETGASRLWQHEVFSTEYTGEVLNWQHKFQQQLEGDGVG